MEQEKYILQSLYGKDKYLHKDGQNCVLGHGVHKAKIFTKQEAEEFIKKHALEVLYRAIVYVPQVKINPDLS